MKLVARIVLGTLLSQVTSAQWHTLGNLDSLRRHGPNHVSLFSGPHRLNIHATTDDIIRVRFAVNGKFEGDSSWAIAANQWPPATITISEDGDPFTLRTRNIVLEVQRRPLRLKFKDASGRALNADHELKGISWCGKEVRVWKDMPQDESYYGFGEKAGRLQRKFTHMTMWNSDIPAYRGYTDPLYQTIPFFYGIEKGTAYGIFFDNSHWSSFDMGKETRDQYSFGAEDGEMNYYFIYGPSPKEVLRKFTDLVGRMPLPPRWSLGYQQCRWSYSPESRLREVARGFRERNIPCDVLYLDIDYMDGYRIFTWNNANFPDPARMIADLGKDGFRIAVIVDPGIKVDTAYHAYRSGLAGGHFLKYPDGSVYTGKVWPGECAFPDFSSVAARRWWGDQFESLVRVGVRGWWNDMNEPSVFDVPTKTVDLNVVHDDNGRKTTHARNHNLYGLQMTLATYEGVRRLLPSERPFVLTRASYAGGHRYSSAWTGDNIASWEHLEMAVPMCLNLSISGQPFVGTDIGGFIGYPSGELFARWLQLAVFTPLMRAHSVINEKNKEPWEYGEEFTEINRGTINLRYQLLPYLYNAMVQASETGIPPMRPLIFEFPNDGHYSWNHTEFMFGNDLLVAPVLWPGATTRTLRLPAGEWYDYWSHTKYQGGTDITVDAPLHRIPLFVRAGAVIPTQQVVQFTDQAPIDPLTLTLFPADSSTSSYFEDDGLSYDYERGVFLRRTHALVLNDAGLTFTVSARTGSYTPPSRALQIVLAAIEARPREIRLNDHSLAYASGLAHDEHQEAWAYDVDRRTVIIRVDDRMTEQKIVLVR